MKICNIILEKANKYMKSKQKSWTCNTILAISNYKETWIKQNPAWLEQPLDFYLNSYTKYAHLPFFLSSNNKKQQQQNKKKTVLYHIMYIWNVINIILTLKT